MSFKSNLKTTLVIGLTILSLGGWLLHVKIHPYSENMANLIPFITGLISIVLLPLLFSMRKTIHFAYILNGLICIFGSVTMAHFSLVKMSGPLTIKWLFVDSLLKDIFIVWGRFAIGKAIFDLEIFGANGAKQKKGEFLRYPFMGWWLVHLISISLVYYLGNLIWR